MLYRWVQSGRRMAKACPIVTWLLRRGAGWSLFFYVSMVGAQTMVGGPITVDTVWPASQNPYVVANDVVVQNGATLTIEAGTTIYMASDTQFTVQSGALKAIGRADSPIRITSQKQQNGQPAAPGDWQQLMFGVGTANASRLEHVQVEYGKGVVVSGASPTFNYLNIKDNQGAAVTIDLAASPVGSGNSASGNAINAIVVPAGDITGSAVWGIKGIPYLIASGRVSVGASPQVSTVLPNELQQGERLVITLLGENLAGFSQVSLGNGEIGSATVDSATANMVTLSVSTNDDAPVVDSVPIRAMTDAGEVLVADALMIVRKYPKLSVVEPSRVLVNQGDVQVVLTGENLTSASSVRVNGFLVSSLYISSTMMRATIPSQSTAGELSIQIEVPDPDHSGEYLVSNVLPLVVEAPALSLDPATASLVSGEIRSLTVILPYPALAGGAAVNIASSAPHVATVPPSVIVLQGEKSASFEVVAVGAGISEVEARYSNWGAAKASLSVLSSSLVTPVAEFRMDEPNWSGVSGEVKDSSGNANHGVAVNGASVAPAKLCSGGYFDGTTDRHVGIPAIMQNLASNTFTMMLWVKPGRVHQIDMESSSGIDGIAGQNYALYPMFNRDKWNWDYSGYAGAGVSVGTNGVSVYEHAGSYMPSVLVWAGEVPQSAWTHVAVVYKEGVPSLYLNGVFRKTGVKGGRSNVVPTYIIGSANYGNYSLGVDEYKVFAKALPAGDVAAIFANENSGRNWDGSARICGTAN